MTRPDGVWLLYDPHLGPVQTPEDPIGELKPIGSVHVSGRGEFELFGEQDSKRCWARPTFPTPIARSRVQPVRGVATPGPRLPRAPWSLFLAMALVVAGCDACTYTPQPEPTPDPDPAPVEPTDCQAAEDNLRDLGCRAPEGFLLADGFADACERNALDGVNWHPVCLAAIDDCSRVDAAWKGVDCQ